MGFTSSHIGHTPHIDTSIDDFVSVHKSTYIHFGRQSQRVFALFSLTQMPLGDRIIGVNRHIRSIGELESKQDNYAANY
jgi:hypothetical protein